MNLEEFNWMNESELRVESDKFHIKSTPNSDFICSPVKGNVIANAPFLFKEVDGSFIINARVKPTFRSTYDACTVFVYANERKWLKTAFEYTDLGTNSIVTVATDNYSDDANGVDIEGDYVYLQIIRKENVFACHYSTNGIDYKMARILRMDAPSTLKIGIAVQSPTGEGQFMEFGDLKISKTLPNDIRKSK
ncbi:MAG: DUF1349 domain-containing protein [Defluviitaleaceae bacterium]|nr:DUF1349 domain-containing protein [Defluviitaleaceae bacterium]